MDDHKYSSMVLITPTHLSAQAIFTQTKQKLHAQI